MLLKKLRSNNKEIDTYIQELEDWIEGFEASNIKKLIDSCDNMAGIIADDIRLIATNQDDETIDAKLQMLGSKKNKIYERFLSLIGQIKHFKTISDILNEIKPKRQPTKESLSQEPESSDKAIEDEVKPRNISDLAKRKKIA